MKNWESYEVNKQIKYNEVEQNFGIFFQDRFLTAYLGSNRNNINPYGLLFDFKKGTKVICIIDDRLIVKQIIYEAPSSYIKMLLLKKEWEKKNSRLVRVKITSEFYAGSTGINPGYSSAQDNGILAMPLYKFLQGPKNPGIGRQFTFHKVEGENYDPHSSYEGPIVVNPFNGRRDLEYLLSEEV